MQEKASQLESTSARKGLKISNKKAEVIRINEQGNTPITVSGEPLKVVESFVNLGSIINKQGGTD